jgi:hypothetical protein
MAAASVADSREKSPSVGQAKVGPGGKQYRSSGGRQAVVAEALQQRRGEPAACRVAAEDEPCGVGAAVQHPPVRGDGIVEGGREGVLGGEPVVDGHHPGPAGRRQVRRVAAERPR